MTSPSTTITALGGGGGGARSGTANYAPSSGGSGGGAAYGLSGAAGVGVNVNNGGNNTNDRGGAGGGGAVTAGTNGNGDVGKNGGEGMSWYGVIYSSGGGGGGSLNSNQAGGSGGTNAGDGGDASGGTSNNGGDAPSNYGGGGGGSTSPGGTTVYGGAGGSGIVIVRYEVGVSVLLSNDAVATNAAPGTLVGTLSDTWGQATHFVLTNAPAGGSADDNDKFQIADGTNLRTRVWMSQYANNVSIAAISNSTALVTNSFPITVTNVAVAPIFVVSAEVENPVSNGDVVGTMVAASDNATFTIVGGRLDLFTKDVNDNLLVANEGSWGGIGTTNYVTLRASSGGEHTDMIVGVAVVGVASSSGTIFRFQ
jgi:hypothetical protein